MTRTMMPLARALTAIAMIAAPACSKARDVAQSDAGAGIDTAAAPVADAAVRNEAADLLARAREQIASGQLGVGRRTLLNVQERFPGSPEAATVAAELARIDQLEKAAAAEDAAAIKKLKAKMAFSDTAGSKVRVNDVSATRKWFFGSYGTGNLSTDADKGSTFIVVSYDVESKEKNPLLACPLFYLRDATATTFHRLVDPMLQFRRWDSFGSYLGNNPDIGNDFAKSDTVQLAGAAQIELTDLAAKYLYVVFAKTPSLTRHEARSHQPPVWYDGDCHAPHQVSASDFLRDFEVVEIRAPRAY